MAKEQLREVSIKNYIRLSLVLLVSILLIFYFYLWYKTYEEDRLNTPIMDEYLQVINYNELNDYLTENKNAVIYVSLLDNSEVRSFEKRFKKLIIDNALKDKILYLNLTEELKNDKSANELKTKYAITLSSIPAILYFQDGTLTSRLNIKEEEYNLQTIENYLTKTKVIATE